MSEAFLHLSKADRLDALEVADAASGRPLHLLEKDVWVVWALETIFGSRVHRTVGVLPPLPRTVQ